MVVQYHFCIQTEGRSLIDITTPIASYVKQSELNCGLCHVFLQHTSASLILCENADPDVLQDMETFMSKLVTDGDTDFTHTAEGKDDMAAHIRSVLTGSQLQLPVSENQLLLGTWQGIFLWEHRYRAHTRKLCVSLVGQ